MYRAFCSVLDQCRSMCCFSFCVSACCTTVLAKIYITAYQLLSFSSWLQGRWLTLPLFKPNNEPSGPYIINRSRTLVLRNLLFLKIKYFRFLLDGLINKSLYYWLSWLQLLRVRVAPQLCFCHLYWKIHFVGSEKYWRHITSDGLEC